MSCRRSFPPHAKEARTFAELYAAYRLLWPDVNADADRLLQLAHKVADGFPDVELWGFLEQCLKHTMKSYDPSRGGFDRLFQRNLSEYLAKGSARAAATRKRVRQGEHRYAADREE